MEATDQSSQPILEVEPNWRSLIRSNSLGRRFFRQRGATLRNHSGRSLINSIRIDLRNHTPNGEAMTQTCLTCTYFLPGNPPGCVFISGNAPACNAFHPAANISIAEPINCPDWREEAAPPIDENRPPRIGETRRLSNILTDLYETHTWDGDQWLTPAQWDRSVRHARRLSDIVGTPHIPHVSLQPHDRDGQPLTDIDIERIRAATEARARGYLNNANADPQWRPSQREAQRIWLEGERNRRAAALIAAEIGVRSIPSITASRLNALILRVEREIGAPESCRSRCQIRWDQEVFEGLRDQEDGCGEYIEFVAADTSNGLKWSCRCVVIFD